MSILIKYCHEYQLRYNHEKKKFEIIACCEVYINVVRMRGLEPPRLAAPDPKSGVYTNFTTSANKADVIILKKWYPLDDSNV